MRNGSLCPIHVLDTATVGASLCPWRALCPAMQYMRQAITQCLIYMCSDDVSATDEQRQGAAAGNLRLSPVEIDILMNYLGLTTMQGVCGDISVYSSVLIYNKLFAGDQRLRCFPFGAAYQFHSKNIQDCVFAIPARKSQESFDISDPEDEKELVFGRLYCIFRIDLYSDTAMQEEHEERDLVLLKVDSIIHI